MLREGGGADRKDVEAVNYSSHPRDNDFPLFVERRKQPTLREIPRQDAFSCVYRYTFDFTSTCVYVYMYIYIYMLCIYISIYIYMCVCV